MSATPRRAAFDRLMYGHRCRMDDLDLVRRTLDDREALVAVMREVRSCVERVPDCGSRTLALDLVTRALWGSDELNAVTP